MPDTPLTHPALDSLRRPLALTRMGMLAERVTRCFWPVWSILLAVLGAMMLGLHDRAPVDLVRALGGVAALALAWFAWRGARAFRRPTRDEALARLDATLRGRPIGALTDTQAIGSADAGSQAVWQAHIARMAERVKSARAVRPDLRMAARDPYALRYAAVLLFAVALLFGSVWRVGTVGELAPGGGAALAAGPAWEGWIEPPAYTGKPSLYLADLATDGVEVPQGSRITLRLYGEVGALRLVEDVSGRAAPAEADAPMAPAAPAGADAVTVPADRLAQSFEVVQSGTLRIDGPAGREWQIVMVPDTGPAVSSAGKAERKADGELRQPFSASDDHGVVGGSATITLNLAALDRRHGLAIAPDPREAIVLDLPMPFTGDRTAFEDVLTDNFSKHPWANMPVTISLSVEDAIGQTGASAPFGENLGGLRFFDPLAKAIVEQRRDLLWARDNARRVAQILRAVSWSPQDIFRDEALYARLRTAIETLEAGIETASLSTEVQEEVAEALWGIAEQLEYGDLADALERLRRAQDRLSEAIKNGASDEEIAGLMEELRQAMQDYMRQLAENAERNGDQDQPQGETQEITQDQLQEMLDRIQELMEQGRMDEAQALLDQLQQMMENMQVTQGQGGQGQPGPGEQAMEDLQDTLREQQGLSDQAFRDLQEKFNPGSEAGQADGNEGREGDGRGRGAEHGGEGQGQGDNPDGQQGDNGDPGQSLADRQGALRRELDRQRGNLPGAGTPEGDAAREALDRAGEAMDGAEQSLREQDQARALDQQSDAMEALREGIRNLGEAMAENQRQQNGQGQAGTNGDPEGRQRDPLGREAGTQGQLGTDENLLQGDDVYRRAEELLDEIRRRSGEQGRPDQELDYLRRLLDRF